MAKLQIKESDLQETFIKSSGKGGQNVNKVSTAVQIKHIPTGTEVKCSIYRTQGLNRYKARVLLCNRLESGSEENEKARIAEKIRKQKQKRRKKNRKKQNK